MRVLKHLGNLLAIAAMVIILLVALVFGLKATGALDSVLEAIGATRPTATSPSTPSRVQSPGLSTQDTPSQYQAVPTVPDDVDSSSPTGPTAEEPKTIIIDGQQGAGLDPGPPDANVIGDSPTAVVVRALASESNTSGQASGGYIGFPVYAITVDKSTVIIDLSVDSSQSDAEDHAHAVRQWAAGHLAMREDAPFNQLDTLDVRAADGPTLAIQALRNPLNNSGESQ